MTDPVGHFFVVGETYEDRYGKYRVIGLEDNRVVFEYANGTRGSGDIGTKSRIHRNILYERSPAQVVRQTAAASQRSNLHPNKPVFFSHDEVFPPIAHVIEKHSKRSDKYMKHDGIVKALMKHPEARLILDRLPKDKSVSWWANDMVAFFSKVFTEGRSKWDGRFERKKIDGKWAYKVRQP